MNNFKWISYADYSFINENPYPIYTIVINIRITIIMPQFLLLYHSNSWLSSKGIVTQTLHTLIEGVIFHYVH